MLTNSGILVMPDNDNAPTIEDIATALGRVPRFGGHTRQWWSVLHHSLVCDRILRRMISTPDAVLSTYDVATARLSVLLHDAHEAITGDIPTDWKTPDMRIVQGELDRRIYRLVGMDPPSGADKRVLQRVDRRALAAEGAVLGPPGFTEVTGFMPEERDCDIVRFTATLYPGPGSSGMPRSPAVQDFTRLVRAMRVARDMHAPQPSQERAV